jgi:hypothetical protein
MSKITRATQQVFGGNLAATGNIAVFGSLKGGSAAYSTDPAAIQAPAWLNGWGGAVVGTNQPTIQDFNAFCNVVSRQVAYILQQGVGEWDAGTTYFTHSIVAVNGALYVSKQDNNTNHSVSDTNWWTNFLASVSTPDPRSLARAWCLFKSSGVSGAGPCLVYSSYNVSSVSATAIGKYRVNWSITAPSTGYIVQAIGGGTYDAFNNNIGFSDAVPPMTSSYVELVEWDSQLRSESGYISVVAYW